MGSNDLVKYCGEEGIARTLTVAISLAYIVCLLGSLKFCCHALIGNVLWLVDISNMDHPTTDIYMTFLC